MPEQLGIENRGGVTCPRVHRDQIANCRQPANGLDWIDRREPLPRGALDNPNARFSIRCDLAQERVRQPIRAFGDDRSPGANHRADHDIDPEHRFPALPLFKLLLDCGASYRAGADMHENDLFH